MFGGLFVFLSQDSVIIVEAKKTESTCYTINCTTPDVYPQYFNMDLLFLIETTFTLGLKSDEMIIFMKTYKSTFAET